MINKFEFIVALRYLRSGKKNKSLSVISGFSLLGIMIGVAALITVMSVMNGFKEEMVEKIVGFNGEICVSQYQNYLGNSEEIIDILKKTSLIEFSYPIIEKQILVASQGRNSGAMIKAFNIEDLAKRKLIYNNIVNGSANFGEDGEDILIGYELANKMGVGVGSEIRFLTSEGSFRSLIGTIPKTKIYKISGIFNSGMYQFDASTIIMNIKAAQRFFDMEGKVSLIEIHIKNPLNSHIIVGKIDKSLKHKYIVTDWQTANSNFFKILETEKVTMFLILTLIIIVAAFNIISSLVMLVKDKTSDIAILRTIGVTNSSVMKIFLLTGSLIGFIGTILGGILGIILALNIKYIRVFLEKIIHIKISNPLLYYLSNLPSKLELSNVINIMSFSILLSFLVTLYPSYVASKLDPAKAIKL